MPKCVNDYTVGLESVLIRFIYTGPLKVPKHNKTQKKLQKTSGLIGTRDSFTCRLALTISKFCYSRVNRAKNQRKNPLLLKKQHVCTYSLEPFNKQHLWQKGAFCSSTPTWLTVDLRQHVFNRVLIVPQGLGVRGSVAVASAPVHHVLCFQGCDAVKPGVLLYDFLQDLSHCHRSLPL